MLTRNIAADACLLTAFRSSTYLIRQASAGNRATNRFAVSTACVAVALYPLQMHCHPAASASGETESAQDQCVEQQAAAFPESIL